MVCFSPALCTGKSHAARGPADQWDNVEAVSALSLSPLMGMGLLTLSTFAGAASSSPAWSCGAGLFQESSWDGDVAQYRARGALVLHCLPRGLSYKWLNAWEVLLGLLEIITEWKPVTESEPDKTESNAGEGRKLCWKGSASPEFLSVKRFGTCTIGMFQPTWLGVASSLFPSARAAQPHDSISASCSLADCTLSYWVKIYT